MNKEQITIYLLTIFIILLFLIDVYLSNNIYQTSKQYDQLEAEIREYKRDNMALENEILSKESLHYIFTQKMKEGFVEPYYFYLPPTKDYKRLKKTTTQQRIKDLQ